VCLASCSRTSRTPAAAKSFFHALRSRDGSIGSPSRAGKIRSRAACQCGPLRSRRSVWVRRWLRSWPTSASGSARVRRDDGVLVSTNPRPPLRREGILRHAVVRTHLRAVRLSRRNRVPRSGACRGFHPRHKPQRALTVSWADPRSWCVAG
jgi:hypothetical protein